MFILFKLEVVELKDLKDKFKKFNESLDLEISPDEVITNPDKVSEKIAEVNERERAVQGFLNRLETCHTANDVFMEYNKDAATTLAFLALHGDSEAIRLKASMAILDRSHGKPVDRSVSITADISGMNIKEIDHAIDKLMAKNGRSKEQGATSLLLDAGGADEGSESPS